MDLSHIRLASTQEAMVDKLAENAHNVWARDRIRQGWTYGIQQACPGVAMTLWKLQKPRYGWIQTQTRHDMTD